MAETWLEQKYPADFNLPEEICWQAQIPKFANRVKRANLSSWCYDGFFQQPFDQDIIVVAIALNKMQHEMSLYSFAEVFLGVESEQLDGETPFNIKKRHGRIAFFSSNSTNQSRITAPLKIPVIWNILNRDTRKRDQYEQFAWRLEPGWEQLVFECFVLETKEGCDKLLKDGKNFIKDNQDFLENFYTWSYHPRAHFKEGTLTRPMIPFCSFNGQNQALELCQLFERTKDLPSSYNCYTFNTNGDKGGSSDDKVGPGAG